MVTESGKSPSIIQETTGMKKLKIALSQMRCGKGRIEPNLEIITRQRTGPKESFMERLPCRTDRS